ncbi:MAG TPA: hypothetical protein VJQ78_05260 [Sphingobium sp.]|nr:hypothetical protein [Sphingobium sp.]
MRQQPALKIVILPISTDEPERLGALEADRLTSAIPAAFPIAKSHPA